MQSNVLTGVYVRVLLHVRLLVKSFATELARVGSRVGVNEKVRGERRRPLERLAALTAGERPVVTGRPDPVRRPPRPRATTALKPRPPRVALDDVGQLKMMRLLLLLLELMGGVVHSFHRELNAPKQYNNPIGGVGYVLLLNMHLM